MDAIIDLDCMLLVQIKSFNMVWWRSLLIEERIQFCPFLLFYEANKFLFSIWTKVNGNCNQLATDIVFSFFLLYFNIVRCAFGHFDSHFYRQLFIILLILKSASFTLRYLLSIQLFIIFFRLLFNCSHSPLSLVSISWRLVINYEHFFPYIYAHLSLHCMCSNKQTFSFLFNLYAHSK